MAPISGDNRFLIVLTELGTVRSMVEMATAEYAIAGGLFFPSNKSSDFVQTDNIQAIAKSFSVPSDYLPAGNAFYHAGKYRMATDGVALVTLSITDANGASPYYKWHFQFGSLKNAGCNPTISVTNW